MTKQEIEDTVLFLFPNNSIPFREEKVIQLQHKFISCEACCDVDCGRKSSGIIYTRYPGCFIHYPDRPIHYKLIKVFDQEKLPKEAQEQATEYYSEKLNDNCYIYHSVQSMYHYEEKLNHVDSFLIEQGCLKNEVVLIHIYW